MCLRLHLKLESFSFGIPTPTIDIVYCYSLIGDTTIAEFRESANNTTVVITLHNVLLFSVSSTPVSLVTDPPGGAWGTVKALSQSQ